MLLTKTMVQQFASTIEVYSHTDGEVVDPSPQATLLVRPKLRQKQIVSKNNVFRLSDK